MARAPMVTRTIQTTEARVLCLDIQKREPVEMVITLPRTFKDEKKLLKACEKAINSDTIKVSHVDSTEVKETRYGMTEQKFIDNADILPPLEKTTVEN